MLRRKFTFLFIGTLISSTWIYQRRKVSKVKKIIFGYKNNKQGAIVFFDLITLSFKHISIPFKKAHEIIQSPTNKNYAYVLEKRGPHIALINIHQQTISKLVKIKDQYNNYGHGFIDTNQNILIHTSYKSDTPLLQQNGYLNFISLNDFSEIKRIKTGGILAHQVFKLTDRLCIVANHFHSENGQLKGGKACLIDYNKNVILKYFKRDDKNEIFDHFHIIKDLNIAIIPRHYGKGKFTGGLKRDITVFIWNYKDDSIEEILIDKNVDRYLPESVFIFKNKYALITSQNLNRVYIIDCYKKELIQTLSINMVKGIVQRDHNTIIFNNDFKEFYEVKFNHGVFERPILLSKKNDKHGGLEAHSYVF